MRKAKKYNDLKVDLESVGWDVQLIPFEVGSRGQITRRNKNSLINVLKRNKIKLNNNQLFKDMSKISLFCSYSVFQAHCVPTWRDPPTYTLRTNPNPIFQLHCDPVEFIQLGICSVQELDH